MEPGSGVPNREVPLTVPITLNPSAEQATPLQFVGGNPAKVVDATNQANGMRTLDFIGISKCTRFVNCCKVHDADNAAGHLMQRGKIDLVIVGSDRTLGRTGEVANKIGTYTKAVLAKRHGIPFYVAIPLSTIDWNIKSGFKIPIEERDESEVLGAWGVVNNQTSNSKLQTSSRRAYVRVANPSSTALNPGFDVTPAQLITGIITPAGIFKPGELWARRRELGWGR